MAFNRVKVGKFLIRFYQFLDPNVERNNLKFKFMLYLFITSNGLHLLVFGICLMPKHKIQTYLDKY
jgi:hypothetical protein